jgi:hypothetical protein
MALGSPSRYTEEPPPESCAAPATLMGFCAPTATSARRSTIPGIPTPVRSAFRVSHPLDGLLPSSLPTSRVGTTHGVHPTESYPLAEPFAFRRHCPPAVSGNASSCSEDQEVTLPRSSRALLPARIRTRPGRSRTGPILSWAFGPLQSVSPINRGDGFPTPSLMRFSRPLSGRTDERRSRALPEDRVGRALAGATNSLEVFHQDLSSASPDDSVPVGYPTGSESACTDERPGSEDPRLSDLPQDSIPRRRSKGPHLPGASPPIRRSTTPHRRRDPDPWPPAQTSGNLHRRSEDHRIGPRRTSLETGGHRFRPGRPSPVVRRPPDPKLRDLAGDRWKAVRIGRPKHHRRSEDRWLRRGRRHRRPNTHLPGGSPRRAPRPRGVASSGVRLGSGGIPPEGLALTPHCQREASGGQALSVPVPGFRLCSSD